MTLILLSLVSFTTVYCKGVDSDNRHASPLFVYIFDVIDIIQIALGPVLHHVFSIDSIMLEEQLYFRDIPLIGLTIHRIIDYFIYGCTLLIYIVCAKKTSRLYREKFLVIIITMIFAGITQGAFIASRTPIDKSILVHGVFGFVVFYFSIIYRPLRLLDAMLSNVASNMKDAIFVFDASHRCVWSNDPGYRMLDKKPGSDPSVLRNSLIEVFGDLTSKGDNWSEDVYIPATKGYYELEKTSVESRGILDGFFFIIKDTTEKHKLIDKELYKSTHDMLTGLYNMNYLYVHIDNVLKFSKEEYCVIYINIRNFKMINDIFGKQFGDETLIQVAKWIHDNFDDKEVIYGRLINDTFGIFMPSDKFDENVFLKGLSDFTITNKGILHKICVHIGIYIIKDKNIDVSVMFDRAHIALSTIPANYKTCVKFYDDSIRHDILEGQLLSSDLDSAIENDDIRPFLQPVIDKDGKIVGAEALARWFHRDFGLLPPIRFIPIFEKNGTIINVDKHIWEDACKILNDFKEINPDLFISINISPRDFYFIDVIKELELLTEKYNIDKHKLRVEITESALINDVEDKLSIFNKLRKAGFIVEMDDFGSGYSSLNLLKDVPVDVLKIDMKFLSDETNDKSDIILKNIIRMANELSITTLTEGVETKTQYDNLVSMGCNLFQGYYFSKPISIEDFKTLVQNK